MSDGLVIPIDGDDTRIRGKLARVKKEAAEAAKKWREGVGTAARVGGPAGGVIGRAFGGFGQSSAMGYAGLSLTAAGLGLNSFLQRDAERVNAARSREQAVQGRDAQARTVLDRREASAADGMSFVQSLRAASFRGGSLNTIRGYTKMANEFGLTTTQGLEIYDAASQFQGVNPEDIAKGLITGVMGTSAKDVAGQIQKFGGLTNALAATQNMTTAQAQSSLDNLVGNPLAIAAAEASGAMNPALDRQLQDLISGETARVMRGKANDELNPAARLAQEASQKVMDTVNQLTAAANAQSSVAALLSEIGRVIGLSEGSASRAVTTFADAQGVQ